MNTSLETQTLLLEDGRTLAYAIYGNPASDIVVIYMHGFPSSRFEGKLWHAHCAKHNIRLISPDRPGSGLSTFQSNRRLPDWPADMRALTYHLNVQRFYLLDVSGGAPYTFACMKEIGKERILGATIVSGLYPMKFGTAGMMLSTRIMLWGAPWMMTGMLAGITGHLTTSMIDMMVGKASRNEDPKVLEDLMSKDIDGRHPDDCKAIKDPANWPNFVAMTRESFRHGSEGVAWEAGMTGSNWAFELEDLCVGDEGIPLTMWHGTTDVNTPVTMAIKAKESLPGCVLHLKDGEGHVSFVFRDGDEILAGLVHSEVARTPSS